MYSLWTKHFTPSVSLSLTLSLSFSFSRCHGGHIPGSFGIWLVYVAALRVFTYLLPNDFITFFSCHQLHRPWHAHRWHRDIACAANSSVYVVHIGLQLCIIQFFITENGCDRSTVKAETQTNLRYLVVCCYSDPFLRAG